ncbi:MarC family protein [Microbulbifer sp. 2304DJ12-6]|uniref:MarC family protein n=1 Tax=Microbulbifer sp. 2304DJ12-6 TaxID=3233340 RepID=UPI00260E9637|nr:MarC family protein [uncultured Microbulbifer sp.]
MTPLIKHALIVFMAFFAIMNPIANTTVFAGLSGDKDKTEQVKIALKALVITFIIILLFALLGKSIFHLFGITLPALRIAGGVIVFLVGYHMLQGASSKLHTSQKKDGADIAVSPMAVPLLAGPGTIATAMSYSAADGWPEIIVTIVVFAILCIITFFCFIFSSKILSVAGKSGLDIITRLMGLILAVIGVQMMIVGVQTAMQTQVLS